MDFTLLTVVAGVVGILTLTTETFFLPLIVEEAEVEDAPPEERKLEIDDDLAPADRGIVTICLVVVCLGDNLEVGVLTGDRLFERGVAEEETEDDEIDLLILHDGELLAAFEALSPFLLFETWEETETEEDEIDRLRTSDGELLASIEAFITFLTLDTVAGDWPRILEEVGVARPLPLREVGVNRPPLLSLPDGDLRPERTTLLVLLEDDNFLEADLGEVILEDDNFLEVDLGEGLGEDDEDFLTRRFFSDRSW